MTILLLSKLKSFPKNIFLHFQICRLGKSEFFSLSNALTTIFQFEEASTFYVPYNETGKTTAGGKLYTQYVSYRKKLGSRNVIQLRQKKKKSLDTDNDATPPKQLGTDISETLALGILKVEVDVDDEKVLNAWNLLFNYRQKKLATDILTCDLIAEFPILTQKDSYKLVSFIQIQKIQ